VTDQSSGQRTAARSQDRTANARAEILEANELELLADRSLELAARYERDAEFMEDERGRQIALALADWRRQRGRLFRELSARTERAEAARSE
jgi:hypothetical protein